jgi:hypothetical protein
VVQHVNLRESGKTGRAPRACQASKRKFAVETPSGAARS